MLLRRTVNACTIGMAASSLVVAVASSRIGRRRGIWISLALLSIPTALLAIAPSLAVFAALRVVQGVFMAAAFALTLAYLGEHFSARNATNATDFFHIPSGRAVELGNQVMV